ncbi:Endonuclease/exonuclease/phosphatase, partial [Cinara cedri]
LFQNLPDVHPLIAAFQPSALCLQETNLKNNKNIPNLKNYKGYFKNRQNQGRASGGVCIFASLMSEHENIPLNTILEAIAIKISSNNSQKICLCNLYAPDSANLTLTDLENLIKQLPHPFILLGDFNSRNTLWGFNYTDRRGRTIEKLLENDSIVLLNDGGSIDWSVQTSYNSNDHWPITLKLLKSQPTEKPTPKWLLRNPNWSAFSNTIENLLTTKQFDILLQTNLPTDIDNIVETFSNIITQAAESTIGKSQPSFIKKKVPGGMKLMKQQSKTTKLH